MATMKLFGIDCDVIYVDSNAAGSNDGSTPDNALTNLPQLSAMSSNKVYLVRRNNTHSVVSSSLTASRVAIMGMPKSTDDLYRVVPTEAKTAWDADPEERFIWIIPASTTATNELTGNYQCFHRIDVRVDGSTYVDEGNSWDAFRLSGNYIRITNIKHSMLGVDLLNYVPPQKVMVGNWEISGDYFLVDGFEHESCGRKQNSSYGRSNASSSYLKINQGQYGAVMNCSFKGQLCYANTQTTFYLGFWGHIPNCIIQNITMTSYVDTTGMTSTEAAGVSYPAGLYVYGSTTETVFRNIKYNFGGVTGVSTNFSRSLSTDLFDFNSTDPRGTIVENINIDFESNWQAGLICPFSGSKLHFYFYDESNISRGIARPPKIENITIKDNAVHPFNAIYVDYMPANVIMKNVTAWTYGSRYAYSSRDRNGVTLENCDFKGRLSFCQSVTRANITNWEVTTINSPQLQMNSGDTSDNKNFKRNLAIDRSAGIVVIQNATLPALQTTDMFIIDDDSTLLIESFNTTPVYTLNSMGTIMVNSEQGVVGNWRYANEDMLLKSVNVQRVGGAAYAIRGNGTGPSYLPAWLGKYPFNGLVRNSAQIGSVGSRTLTLFAAYKGYVTYPMPENIFVEIDIPSGGTGTERRIVNTRNMGYTWESDTSSWTGDSGLTTIKLVIPFQYERAEDIQVRIGAYWNEPGSYFYIDPIPVFG